VSLTWRGNLGFVVAGMITSEVTEENEPFLFYADALDGFSTRTIQVTGRASGTQGDWFSAIDPQGRLWDGAEPAGSSAAQVVTVTDWHPDQATATATPLSGSLVQTGRGQSSVILSPDGKEVYADDRLCGTSSWCSSSGVSGPDQSATISVDTLVAEPVPDPEEQLSGSDNPLIDDGWDYNFWVAMTQR
jgi:DNA-binding beta-propeller fold protein YncE